MWITFGTRDVLIFLNETNIIKPPIALTIDRVKSEFIALRRQHKSIRIGICRCSDRSLFNNATIQHLGSLIFHEFENLSHHEECNENGQSPSSSPIVNTESKKLLHIFSNKKKSTSTRKQKSTSNTNSDEIKIQDQNPISNSDVDRSEISVEKIEDDHFMATQQSSDSLEQSMRKRTGTSTNQVTTQTDKQWKRISSNHSINKSCPSPRNSSTQIFTDACFVYRRQIIKQPDTTATILRGREIAYEAAHSPTIPLSMPNYTHDQIRELYGEIDTKTRRSQENQYILHTPLIDAWNEKSSWNLPTASLSNQCPLPKFHLDNSDQTICMTTYVSTGLSNPPVIPQTTNEKEVIRGSFRTSIDDRTNISPSPLLLNVRFDFNQINPMSTNSNDYQSTFLEDIQRKLSIEQQTEITSAFDCDNIQQRPSEQSEAPSDNMNSKTPLPNTPEAIDIDSLIDLDDRTATSYHTAKEPRVETELYSLLSTKNNPTTNIPHESVNANPLITYDDLLNTITSTDNSCYYDAFTSSIPSNIFPDNFFEQIEALNHTGKLSPIQLDQCMKKDGDVHKNPSIENLMEIVHDMNERPSCVNHLVFVYEDGITRIEEQDEMNINKSMESNDDVFTDDKAHIKLSSESSMQQSSESDYPLQVPITNPFDCHQSSLNEENHADQITHDSDEDFEDLYCRYLTNLDQYQTILEQIDTFEQKQHPLTPISEEPNAIIEHVLENSSSLSLTVKRQRNHIGHYGFELEQTIDGRIQISSIINSYYCPNLNVSDEILSINMNSTLTTLEQYHLLLHSLWYSQCESIKLQVRKPMHISIVTSK